MSNWHRRGFTDPLTNIAFGNSEAAFMWYKARFFGDAEAMDALKDTTLHPRESKDIGGRVRGYDEKAWECVRFGYMVYVNYLKFSQNQDLKEQLLATGDKILVEASPYDKIWGIGLAEGEPDEVLSDTKNWKGRNLLGEALMKVRDLLK